MRLGLKTWIVVRHQFDALHHWPDAPRHREYLASSHRHMFFVELRVQVFNDDRELEFHDVLRALRDQWCTTGERVDGTRDIGALSCEMIAGNIICAARERYGRNRDYRISVFEDDENGAIVEWDREAE